MPYFQSHIISLFVSDTHSWHSHTAWSSQAHLPLPCDLLSEIMPSKSGCVSKMLSGRVTLCFPSYLVAFKVLTSVASRVLMSNHHLLLNQLFLHPLPSFSFYPPYPSPLPPCCYRSNPEAPHSWKGRSPCVHLLSSCLRWRMVMMMIVRRKELREYVPDCLWLPPSRRRCGAAWVWITASGATWMTQGITIGWI